MKLGNRRSLVAEQDKVSERPMEVQSPVTLGMHSGKWCSYATGPDLSGDQRPDDGGALVFQTAVLEDDLEILGAPVVELELASEQPLAQVAVRLSDMRPDHQVTRVTYGLLNLSHRDGSEEPEPLEPGMRYRVKVPMNYVARRFPAGHRIRLSVSTVYWPLAWTPPESVRLKIWTGSSQLMIPCRPTHDNESTVAFDEPVCASGPRLTSLQPAEHRWLVKQDLARKHTELEVIDDRGVFRLEDIDLTVGAHAIERYSALAGDFSSVRGTTEWIRTLSRGDWSIKTRTRTTLSADKKNFYISAELDAWEGKSRVRCLSWNETIARDHL